MKKIEWGDFIHSDPQVLLGKPVVKGTRLSVEFILGLYAEGWTEAQIIENYPKKSENSESSLQYQSNSLDSRPDSWTPKCLQTPYSENGPRR